MMWDPPECPHCGGLLSGPALDQPTCWMCGKAFAEEPKPELRLRTAIEEALQLAQDYGYGRACYNDDAVEEIKDKLEQAKQEVESQLRLAEIQVKVALGLETEAIERGHAIMVKAEADELRSLHASARRIQEEARGSHA